MLLLSLLADIDMSTTVNSKEYSPMLLAQLINIVLVILGGLVSLKILRKQPPIGEELVKIRAESLALSVRIDAVERWIAKLEGDTDGDLANIQRRLKEGDDLFKQEIADVATIKANVNSIGQDVHIMKNQITTLLANSAHRPRKA